MSDLQPEKGITVNLHVARIVFAVAEVYGMPMTELTGKSRSKSASEARHVAMYLARSATARSYPELGRDFGRDGTSVLNGIRKVGVLLEKDERVRAAVESVAKALRGQEGEAA